MHSDPAAPARYQVSAPATEVVTLEVSLKVDERAVTAHPLRRGLGDQPILVSRFAQAQSSERIGPYASATSAIVLSAVAIASRSARTAAASSNRCASAAVVAVSKRCFTPPCARPSSPRAGSVQRLGDHAALANGGCGWEIGSNRWPNPEPSAPL